MATKPRKKLEGNGMWESSRMMLPEHIVRINQWATEIKKRERIELDEQEWEDVSRAVVNSMQQRQQAKLRMFHELVDLEIVGIVERVDQLKGRFIVDGEWFAICDIEGAQIEH